MVSPVEKGFRELCVYSLGRVADVFRRCGCKNCRRPGKSLAYDEVALKLYLWDHEFHSDLMIAYRWPPAFEHSSHAI